MEMGKNVDVSGSEYGGKSTISPATIDILKGKLSSSILPRMRYKVSTV